MTKEQITREFRYEVKKFALEQAMKCHLKNTDEYMSVADDFCEWLLKGMNLSDDKK